jgi:hypothetical protein
LFKVGVKDFYFSLYHTQTHTAVGRSPLYEGSARRRDLYLATQTLYKHKGSLYTFTKNSNDPKAMTHYVNYRRILKKIISEAKKQHCNRLIATPSNKVKTAWNVIKKETGKLRPTEQVPSLVVSNGKKDPKSMANTFNNFFLTVTEKLNIQKFEKGAAISFLKDSFPGNFPSIKIIRITEAEIQSIIRSLKPKKKNSSGYEEITSKILKPCASVISHPLSFICNQYVKVFSLIVSKLQL